ncbi:hypothetical protein [Pseudomonas sp. PIC25]|uniref:hypothetical protein n=1 Tax=Pseudomonas sp. PIC25 TaxID=1958773 RepID=UPI00117AE6A4|nr:hypothetical protein [Pseudomonas sp. PIC25]
MECLLYVLVAVSEEEKCAQLLLNLSVEKPVLEEDVELQWRPMFNALEFLPLPEEVKVLDDGRVLIAWPLRSDSDPARYISALTAANVFVMGALEAFEDGGYCYVELPKNGESATRGNRCAEEEVFFSPGRVAELLSSATS